MDWDQLDALHADFNAAAKAFKDVYSGNYNNVTVRNDSFTDASILSVPSPEAEERIAAVRSNICGILSRMHNLCAGPSSFIYQLATHNQLLACLKWLGEFQVIACVPLSGSVSIEELADLTDVPRLILSRVVRMTATAGFLHEPKPGFVAHTSLSSSFSTELNHFDAAMFLCNNVAPSALRLASVTQSQNLNSQHPVDGPQQNRQWSAYDHSLGGLNDSLTTMLSQWNWQSLGEASIVHICPRYSDLSKALLDMSRTVRLVLQTYEAIPSDVCPGTLGRSKPGESISHRIAFQRRKVAEPQSVKDAAVYILQPSLSPLLSNGTDSHELLNAELQAHISVLRANPNALLIFAPTLLPEPGSVPVDEEAQARLRDFAHLQLGNESAVEVPELVNLIEGVCDRHGKLTVTNHLRSSNSGATVAMGVQYQSFAVSDLLMSPKEPVADSNMFLNKL